MERIFGVEFEFATHQDNMSIIRALETRGLPIKNVNSYRRTSGAAWELKTDSSAGGNSNHGRGWEIASRTLKGNDGLKEVEWYVSAMNSLRNDNGWRVNRCCGVHVHFDLSDFNYDDLKNLIRLVMYHEKLIFGINPVSRQSTTYCRKIQGDGDYEYLAGMNGATDPERVRTILDRIHRHDSRYYGLNLVRFITHKRIEFRYGGATLSSKKAVAWVLFLMGIVEKAKGTQRSRIDPRNNTKTLKERKNEARRYMSNLRSNGIQHGLSTAHSTIEERFEKFSASVADMVPEYGG